MGINDIILIIGGIFLPNEIVKYKNKFNSLKIGGEFTHNENNIFMAIISRLRHTETIKNTDKGKIIDTKPVTLSYKKIRLLCGIHYGNHLSRFKRDLRNTRDKMMSLSAYHNDKNVYLRINLFSYFYANKKNKICKIKLNPDYYDWLNALTKQFTRFSLKQITGISSSYAQNMFRYIKTFRTSGLVIINKSKLRRLLGFPKSYTGNQIQNRVIKPIEIELTPLIKGLHIVKRTGERNRILGYKITFSPESPKKDDFASDPFTDKYKKIRYIKRNPFLRPKLKDKAVKKVLNNFHNKIHGNHREKRKKTKREPIKVFNRTLKQASLSELEQLYAMRKTPVVNMSEYQTRKLRKTIRRKKAHPNSSL